MPIKSFFKDSEHIVKEGQGPTHKEQLYAMAKDQYWTVLNTKLLESCHNNKKLLHRANAFKHALQTFGPTSENLPNFINNKGAAKGSVFHGHVNDSNGNTYVLEWAVLDNKKRIMALVGFKSHENYPFKQMPLSQEEIDTIFDKKFNRAILATVPQKIQEAKNKVARIEHDSGQINPIKMR